MKEIYQQLHKGLINDYLDLFNYAKSIGDTLWQNDILFMLSNLNNNIHEHVYNTEKYNLWNRFEELNKQIDNLYKSTSREKRTGNFVDKILSLKEERGNVLDQITEIEKQIKQKKYVKQIKKSPY